MRRLWHHRSVSSQDTSDRDASLGVPAMVALVIGGMVGGGIYVALGVVIEASGRWAWLSFVIAGVVAVTTAHSYGALSTHFETGGGVFAFLEKIDRDGAAGSLSWTMIIAYTLTLGLYAFAFGQYVAYSFGGGAGVTRVLSVVVIVALTGLNLLGVADLTRVEIAIVGANLALLMALGVAGIADWSPERLSPSPPSPSVWAAGVGAAAIFVSYEGFQLLTYEYDQLRRPDRLTAVLAGGASAVVAVYVLVALGATMLVGADAVVGAGTVSLSVAAEAWIGTAGLVAMTVAAAFATSAAINSTLFSTAQLTRRVADDGELPSWFDHRNSNDVPDRAVIVIAVGAAVLAVTGSLSSLVEAASMVFLSAFAVVNLLALRTRAGSRAMATTALLVGGGVGVVLVYRLLTTKPFALAAIVCLMVVSFAARPWLLSRMGVDDTEQ